MTARLSADERDLLREWVHVIAPVIANPGEECRRLRESRRSGGGFGRNYEVTGQRFTGTWAHYEVTDRFTTGPPTPDNPHACGSSRRTAKCRSP